MENLQLYHYDRDTKEYVGTSFAKPDPMVKGRFLIPSYASIKPVPVEVQNKAIVFDEDKDEWDYADDFRGTIVLAEDNSDRTEKITTLGVKPSDIVFEELPEPTYQEKRAMLYPDIGDQLDAIMKWAATETEITVTPELKSIAMRCMNVKSQVPKE